MNISKKKDDIWLLSKNASELKLILATFREREEYVLKFYTVDVDIPQGYNKLQIVTNQPLNSLSQLSGLIRGIESIYKLLCQGKSLDSEENRLF